MQPPSGQNRSDRRAIDGRMSPADLVTIRLSAWEWRIHHRRYDATDVRGMVGFITLRAGMYEVVRIGRPLERAWRPSLESGLDYLVRPHVFAASLVPDLPVVADVDELVD